ncbi:MAG: dienelactone hydrolase family protein [Actinomycetes bacterium]
MERETAYFVGTQGGPGVLLLHSFWGLTPSVKKRADQLADAGFMVLAPDITFGERPVSEQEAVAKLAEADVDRLARLVLVSTAFIHEKGGDRPIGIVGFGMGGSMGLWASVRAAHLVRTAVSFYGTQQIDFTGSRSSYMIHLAEEDAYVTDDDAAFMEATIALESLPVEVFRYPGTRHGFGEPESDVYDPESFELAWSRTVEFLTDQLSP